MEYLGVLFPPIVVGDRSTGCISSYARGLIAEKITKPPFSFEVSIMTRQLLRGMQEACGCKEPSADFDPPCLAHSTIFAIAFIYLLTVKVTVNGVVLWTPIGPIFPRSVNLTHFQRHNKGVQNHI
jgi:hypothetical protein